MAFQADKRRKLLAALVTSLLFWLAWPASGVPLLLFIAWLPLLWLERKVYTEKINGKSSRLFIYTYIAFLLFNLLTTWWIYFASPFGMVGAVFANALLMAFVFQVFHVVHLRTGDTVGYVTLVVSWLAFEYLHLNWDLSWPWLNLGNGFAAWPNLVQWYEYTGAGGGTLWILLVNILIFKGFTNPVGHKSFYAKSAVVILFFPMLLSGYIRYRYDEKINPAEIVIVQPNIDPYNEKFSGMSSDAQLDRLLSLAAKGITPGTRLVVCPETAMPEGIWEEQLNENPGVMRLGEFSKTFHDVPVLTGIASFKMYSSGVYPASARRFRDTKDYYDAFNTAMLLDPGKPLQLYHKSKLVPGVEKMPFPAVFKYLDQFAIDLGGIAGTLGQEDSAITFHTGIIRPAPIVCYESIYGEYVGEYVRHGANLLCIITNDGWWRNTPGYRQHCQYARLRAIEHRRSIARSANTGTSCFINQVGDIKDATAWWVPAMIRGNVNLNSTLTFYSLHGDYLQVISCWLTLMIIIYTAIRIIMRRRLYKR